MYLALFLLLIICVVVFLFILLTSGIFDFLISLLPTAPSPVEKLIKQQGHITNIILGEKTTDVVLPLELKNFAILNIKGNYITDIFTQSHNNETLYSFLLHGKTFQPKRSLSNLLPGAGLVGETEIRCWFGKLPISLPDAEIFYRHIPLDIPPFCTKKIFSSGNTELDQKYVFAGDPKFISFLSPSFIDWIEKNRLYIMISSDWMLLLDVKMFPMPNDNQAWQNQMQDMSAWVSLQEILSNNK